MNPADADLPDDADVASGTRCRDGALTRESPCDVAKALRETQARLSLAQKAAGIGIWEYDPDKHLLTWSPEQFPLHGIDPAEGPPGFADWLAMVEPEFRPIIESGLSDLLGCHRRSLRLEFRIRRRGDGAPRWLGSFCRVLPRPDGTSPTLVGVNYDVTDLRAAEARLRVTADLLSLVEAGLGVGIWEIDLAQRTAIWSPAQFAQYGLDAAAGAPSFEQWIAMVQPEDRPPLFQVRDLLLARNTEVFRREYRIRRADTGALRWLAAFGRLAPGEGDEASKLVGFSIDITDLRQAESELRRTTTLLGAIGACSPAVVFAKDMQGRYLYANPVLQHIAGRQEAELLGRTNAEILPDPVQAAALSRDDDIVLASGRPVSAERPVRRRDGVTRVFQTEKAPLLDEQGATIGLVGVSVDITGLKEAEAARRASDKLFRATFEQAAVGMAHVQFDGTPIMVNDRLCDLLGYSREECMRMKWCDVTHPNDADELLRQVSALHACNEESVRTDKRCIRRDGSVIWITLTVSMVRDEAGAPLHYIAVLEDLTQRKLAEQALQESRARARRLFDGAPVPNYLVDPNSGEIVDSNEAASAMLGYTRDEFRGMKLDVIDMTDTGRDAIPHALAQHNRPMQFETKHRARSGDVHDVLISVVPMDLGGRRLAHGTVIDISARKLAEAELKHRAEHDGLTGLGSRAWFIAQLGQMLQRAGGARRGGGALILVDVDYFKQVNDTRGHDAGDALLVAMAARLRTRGRPEDIWARLGGDEFAMLIPGMREERGVAARMAEIMASMTQAFDIGGNAQHVTVSMGAATFTRGDTDAHDVLKWADLALYEAKRSGRGCWRFFRAEQAETMHRHVAMAEALRRAIDGEAIDIALQPKRTLAGAHAGFEALARWYDGETWVAPGEFIPVAEAAGLLRPICRIVLEKTLTRIRELRSRHLNPGRVAVNVGGPDLLDPYFVPQLRAALRRHRLSPRNLEVEVTETVLLGRTADRVDAVLRELQAMGIAVALDDFGTGFASLAHIGRLAVDRLKIDRSFIADIGRNTRSELIARSIIVLARELHMDSVAEGVEAEAQLAFLREAGCRTAQGFLISPPLLGLEDTVDYLQLQGVVEEAKEGVLF